MVYIVHLNLGPSYGNKKICSMPLNYIRDNNYLSIVSCTTTEDTVFTYTRTNLSVLCLYIYI